MAAYPVPLTPLVGGKDVELGRAKLSEAAMNRGAAISHKDVLFQDDWLLAVNKPAGVYSEHVLISVPTLWDHPYSAKYPMQAAEGLPHLHLANRLDRDTSGVLVVTKCKQAAGEMSRTFERGEVRKSYLALCSGVLPSWRTATIFSGHGRSRHGCWRVYSEQDIGNALPKGVVKRMVTKLQILGYRKSCSQEFIASLSGEPDGEEQEIHAVTQLGGKNNEAAKQVGDKNKEEAKQVFIRAFPQTGRTHQIRLHCQYLGMPLAGDVKYNGPQVSWNGEQCNRHFLHAESMEFTHPFSAQQLHLVAPAPAWAACIQESR